MLRPLSAEMPALVLHCLPDGIQDPFGRPMVALRLTPFCDEIPGVKISFLRNMELLRQHLAYLNQLQQRGIRPILQYVALLDIGGMTFHHVVRRTGRTAEMNVLSTDFCSSRTSSC